MPARMREDWSHATQIIEILHLEPLHLDGPDDPAHQTRD